MYTDWVAVHPNPATYKKGVVPLSRLACKVWRSHLQGLHTVLAIENLNSYRIF